MEELYIRVGNGCVLEVHLLSETHDSSHSSSISSEQSSDAIVLCSMYAGGGLQPPQNQGFCYGYKLQAAVMIVTTKNYSGTETLSSWEEEYVKYAD